MAVATGEAALKPVDDAQAALMPELGVMLRAFWVSPIRTNFAALTFAIVMVIALTAYGQIKLNEWNQPFYDALARKDWQEFINQLFRFAQIAIALLVMNVAQAWLNQSIKIKLREGLVHDLVEQWLNPGRAFRLSTRPIGINPDQRMHEDARHLTELSTDLSIGLLQASVLLFSFVGVLWALSSGFVFHLGTANLTVPGYLVWAAVFYAGSASVLSYLVGRPLVGLNAERYSREADLRYGLMRVSEHIDAITLANGEPDEKRRITIDLAKVLAAMRRLAWSQTRLTWITAGYGWTALVVPVGVAAPAYFSGSLSFGGLMVTVGAFNQVQSSLRWFVDNFSVIADWRATLLRSQPFGGQQRKTTPSEMASTGFNWPKANRDITAWIASASSFPTEARNCGRKARPSRPARRWRLSESGAAARPCSSAPWRDFGHGDRQDRAAEGRGDHVYASYPLPASREFARSPRLPRCGPIF